MKLTETGDAQVTGGPRAGRGVFGMMGRIRGSPGWADDPVQQQGGSRWMGRWDRSFLPPRKDIG